MTRHQVKGSATLRSLTELAEVTAQWAHEDYGPVRIRVRIGVPSWAAASTIAAQWVRHGGRSVIVVIQSGLRVPVEVYGRRRWWWSR